MNNNLDIKFIDVSKFKNNRDNCIIIDCRSLKQYEALHIENATHLCFRDKITQRRLLSNRLSVKDLLDDQIKHKIDENKHMIVIYDESTKDENDLNKDQELIKIVFNNIHNTIKNVNCKILKGGFNEFSKIFPKLCATSEKITSIFTNSYDDKLKDEIENAKVSKITDNLYLGNECDANNETILKNFKITHIINVTDHIPNFYENIFQYIRIPVQDSERQNIKQYFEKTNLFIDEAIKNNGNVLVHCFAGISRSATIVIAYIMKSQNLKFDNAYKKVKEKRSIISPNISFTSQLMDFEKILFKNN